LAIDVEWMAVISLGYIHRSWTGYWHSMKNGNLCYRNSPRIFYSIDAVACDRSMSRDVSKEDTSN
jgi:hypothetical protein